MHIGDAVFAGVARFSGAFVLVLLGAIIVVLFLGGFAAFSQFGPLFLVSAAWDPVKEVFGAAVPVYGTIVTSILALIFAVPVSFGIAFYLTELAPAWLRRPIGTAIELLAAVPSIIYGMWGFFVIAPLMARIRGAMGDRHVRRHAGAGGPVRRARRSAPASSPPR